jgi:hypothetical protein
MPPETAIVITKRKVATTEKILVFLDTGVRILDESPTGFLGMNDDWNLGSIFFIYVDKIILH